MAASYFDVDGTLVSTNLVHPTLFYLLNQGTPVQTALRFGRALLKAPAMGFAEVADRRTFNELLYSSYEGMSEDRLVLLAEDVFEKVLRPSIYPAARDLVRGITTTLCSGVRPPSPRSHEALRIAVAYGVVPGWVSRSMT